MSAPADDRGGLTMAELDARAFGALEAEVRHLSRKVDAMAGDMKELSSLLAQARGGWRVMVAVCGLAATIGAVASKAAAWFRGL